MKQLIILLVFTLFISCSKDDSDNGCKCNGEFSLVSGGGSFFTKGVDCNTGQPMTDIQNEGGNPVFYLGCTD